MKLLLALTIIACACAAHAAITTRVNILTENKFEALNPEWVRGERAAPNDLVNFRLYLWQQNRDELDRVFNDITDPYSPNYGACEAPVHLRALRAIMTHCRPMDEQGRDPGHCVSACGCA